MWRWLGLGLSLLAGAVTWAIWNGRRRPPVSEHWLRDQRRREMGEGQNGINWSWPVKPDDRTWREHDG